MAGRRRALGGRIFGGIFVCLGFVAFGTHLVLRAVPGRPARSGSVELGTSRVVGKQGERGEAKLSTRQTRLETRWREMKEIEKSETRERRERTLNLPLHTYFPLFITILIGLNYPTFLFYMSGQKDIFLFGTFLVLVYTVRNLKVVYP